MHHLNSSDKKRLRFYFSYYKDYLFKGRRNKRNLMLGCRSAAKEGQSMSFKKPNIFLFILLSQTLASKIHRPLFFLMRFLGLFGKQGMQKI
jgi:hypothetical protein